jgi:hypothetical protein
MADESDQERILREYREQNARMAKREAQKDSPKAKKTPKREPKRMDVQDAANKVQRRNRSVDSLVESMQTGVLKRLQDRQSTDSNN